MFKGITRPVLDRQILFGIFCILLLHALPYPDCFTAQINDTYTLLMLYWHTVNPLAMSCSNNPGSGICSTTWSSSWLKFNMSLMWTSAKSENYDFCFKILSLLFE